MKRIILPLLILVVFSTIPWSVSAQTTYQTATSKHQTNLIPFRITFLGTRHYNDINPIVMSLKELPYIEKLVPSLESQSRLEFDGLFTGVQRSLTADIASLVANRFAMNQSSDEKNTLIITLKKIKTPNNHNAF